jgi:hypothetical protein
MDPEVQELPPRALAMEMAAATDHFGPFLADLAERSLMGVESGPPRRLCQSCAWRGRHSRR